MREDIFQKYKQSRWCVFEKANTSTCFSWKGACCTLLVSEQGAIVRLSLSSGLSSLRRVREGRNH